MIQRNLKPATPSSIPRGFISRIGEGTGDAKRTPDARLKRTPDARCQMPDRRRRKRTPDARTEKREDGNLKRTPDDRLEKKDVGEDK